jgi:carboxymethylenebutenolidase
MKSRTDRTLDTRFDSSMAAYKGGALDRRAFLARLIALTGSMAATHLLLESSGWADTVVSEIGSSQMKVSSSTIEYPSTADAKVTAYLSVPGSDDKNGKEKFPAVIVIHENRGLNDHTRDVVRRFAVAGFVALAPDLLSRKGGTAAMASPDKAREAITSLSSEDAIADLKAGLAYLNEYSMVRPGQLGSVGFCWGGARSFLLAAESELLKAAVVFYGSAPPLDKLAQVHCPVLGLYGETDERITSRVPEVAQAMKQAGKQFEYKIYSGAGHAFFNDTGERYQAEAAKDAWTRTLTFLHAHLKT